MTAVAVSAGSRAASTYEIVRLARHEVKAHGIASTSTVAWVSALNPPRLCPMACTCCPFLPRQCADRPVRWWSRSWRTCCPRPVPGARRHAATRRPCTSTSGAFAGRRNPQTFGRGAPRDAGAVAIGHCADEQVVIASRHAHTALAPGQQILDALPRVIPERVPPCHRSSSVLASVQAQGSARAC